MLLGVGAIRQLLVSYQCFTCYRALLCFFGYLSSFYLRDEFFFIGKSTRLLFAINQRVIVHNFEDAAAGLYQLNF